MEDVARRAGVSLMTVSRSIRAPAKVADATRARIDKAIAELGYVRDMLAGHLAGGRARLVAVVLPDLANPAFAAALQGLADALGPEFELILAGSHGGLEGEARVIRTLLGYRPAGIVIHGGRHDTRTQACLKTMGVPVIEIGSLAERPLDLLVGYSNRAAGRAATEHLLAKGRRHIGFVSQPLKRDDRAEERWRGYHEALRAAGLPLRPELEIETGPGYEQGALTLIELMRREPRLDAVFFTSDGWAMGALFHCQRAGIAVPQRIAMIGFDDQEFAAQTVPALTTIRVPRYEMGRHAGRLLRARLASQPIELKRLDLGFELIERETT